MSTNFYLHVNACPSCKVSASTLHIGKRSNGWCFEWRGYLTPDSPFIDGAPKSLKSVEEWRALILDPKHVVRDEYGDATSGEKFLAMVEEWDAHVLLTHPERPRGRLVWGEFS